MHFTQSTSEAQKKFNKQNEDLFKTDLGIPANIQLNKNLRHDVRFILYEFFAFYSKCVRGTRRLIKKNIDFLWQIWGYLWLFYHIKYTQKTQNTKQQTPNPEDPWGILQFSQST